MGTGTSPAICPEKDGLIEQWRKTRKGLGICVKKLMLAALETKRLTLPPAGIVKSAVENARTMLEIHRAEKHGC